MGYFSLEVHKDFHFTEEIIKIYDSRDELHEYDIAFPKSKPACNPPYISEGKICRLCYYMEFGKIIKELRKSKRKEFLIYQLELRNDKLQWLDELDVLFIDHEDQFDNIDYSFAYEYREIIEELRTELATVNNDSNGIETITENLKENAHEEAVKRKWYQKLWVWFTGLVVFLAALITIINGTTDFFSRLKSNSTPKNEEEYDRILFSTKTIRITKGDLGLNIYKTDTIEVKITSGQFIIMDSCHLNSTNYLNEEYLFKDEEIGITPEITILDYNIRDKVLNKNQLSTIIVVTLELDLIPNGFNVGWLEEGRMINIVEFSYDFIVENKGELKPEIVKNLIQLN